MSNSDWMEADRIDRLKPVLRRFYDYATGMAHASWDEMDKGNIPAVYIDSVQWDSPLRVVATVIETKRGRRKYVETLWELRDALEFFGVTVPSSLDEAIWGEETLDYRLNSGNSQI